MLVVLPTYNERDNLVPVVQELRALGYELLVVDDASPDGTGEIADGLAACDPGVMVLHRPAKLGLGSAYLAGFHQGLGQGYQYLVEMDADRSHRPRDLSPIVAACREAGGLVIGSRYVAGGSVSGWSPQRKLLSGFANLYCRLLLGWKVRDATSGFRCFRADALTELGLDRVRSSGYEFQVEMVHRCQRRGLTVSEVPIRFEERQAGRSKLSRAEIANGVLGVLRLRFRSPS